MFKKNFLAMAVFSALLAGCSSGGSSGDGDGGGMATGGTLTGTVAKGIIKNGIVTAYVLGSTNAVGSAVTNDKGEYVLMLSESYDGTSPILLEVTPGDTTQMICDVRPACGATAFGQDIAIAASTGFKLSAASTSVSNNTTTNMSITPFTSMAAAKVQTGETTNAAVQATNLAVSELVGVNITETNPVNIAEDLGTADANAQQLTIMLSALANQAFEDTDSSGSVDVTDAISNLNSFNADYVDGEFGNDDGGLAILELYADAQAEVATSADVLSDDNTTGDFATNQIADNPDGTFTPFEEPAVVVAPEVIVDNVTRAKGFVAEVRTWANAIQDLEAPAELFLDEAEAITNTLDTNSQAVLEVLGMALEAISNEIDDADDTNRAIATTVQVMDEGQLVGNITLADNSVDGSTTAITASASDLNGVSMNAAISVNLDRHLDDGDVIAAGDKMLTIDGNIANDSVSLTLADAAFTMTLAEDFTFVSGGDDSDSSSNDNGDNQEPSIAGMSLKGKLTAEVLENGTANGDKVAADAEIKYVTLDASVPDPFRNEARVSLEKFALNNLSVTSQTGSTGGLSVSLTMNNAASIDTQRFLDGDDSIINEQLTDNFSFYDFDVSAAENSFGINVFQQYSYNFQYTFDNLGVIIGEGFRTCAAGYTTTGAFVNYSCVDGDVSDLKGQIATKYSSYPTVETATLQSFSYHDVWGGRIFGSTELQLTDLESAENFLDATLTITGSVDLADHPAATLTVTANKTGIEKGDLTATLAYSGKSMQMTANTDGGDEENTSLSMSFSNANGVAMSVSTAEDWETGSVTVGDEVVGTIEDLDDALIIRYSDGTFESL